MVTLVGLCTGLIITYASFMATFKGTWRSSLAIIINALLGYTVIYLSSDLATLYVQVLGGTPKVLIYLVAAFCYIILLVQLYRQFMMAKRIKNLV